MGSSTDADIVKACAGIWQDGNSMASCCYNNPPTVLIPYYNRKFDTEYADCSVMELPVVINGWTSPDMDGRPYEWIGKKSKIIGEVWSKGEKSL